ncbi:uncharacterized protein LOC103372291 isoform X3 [Stegastes partitus]|uniref:Uncharacterized protein LOC103372291 isoform X3 n=1 Tax=Stegastes partitus TaxID=144197 RepID=A0A9Y4U0V1_9TELE|nr:PREDICTED: uncharacterized protein LOC103372291 isoform X3 [Stegastes partitus]
MTNTPMGFLSSEDLALGKFHAVGVRQRTLTVTRALRKPRNRRKLRFKRLNAEILVRFNMGKTADLTTGQKTITDTLYRIGKPQMFIAKQAGCSQSAVSKHINGKSSGRAKCGRRRCTSKRDDRGLQRIIKQTRFKNLEEIQKEWNEARVTASKTTTFRRIREMGYNCWVPPVKPLLILSQRRKHLNWAKEKKDWTVGQWSKVLFSDES